jgi:basic membrane lipoprotein Med (substrate-binding protein (PBP1-ABC) superfamily)
VFITTSGSTVRENVAPIVFEIEQATYVLGYIGAEMSRSGRLGVIGGMEIPSVASTFNAFEAGARASRATVVLTRSYIGGWEDVAAAKEATLAQIAQGADVLIHNADAAGQGFFQALRESPQAVGFGTNRDQNSLAPDSVLASATLDIPRALVLVAREVRDGVFKARPIEYGLKDGVVGIVWNEPLLEKRGGDIREQADALVAQIESGTITVPRSF